MSAIGDKTKMDRGANTDSKEGRKGCAADGVGCRSVDGVGCRWGVGGRCVSMVVCPLLSCRSVSPSRGGGGASQMRNARGGG